MWLKTRILETRNVLGSTLTGKKLHTECHVLYMVPLMPQGEAWTMKNTNLSVHLLRAKVSEAEYPTVSKAKPLQLRRKWLHPGFWWSMVVSTQVSSAFRSGISRHQAELLRTLWLSSLFTDMWWGTELVFCSCSYKCLQPLWLKTTQTFSLIVLEVTSPTEK